MTELKTLKDFRKMQPALLIFDLLQAEGIKWIKMIDKDLKPYEILQGKPTSPEAIAFVNGNIATREWIKNFFNITEEEIK